MSDQPTFDVEAFKQEISSEFREIFKELIKSETASQLNGALNRFERQFPEKLKSEEIEKTTMEKKTLSTRLAEIEAQLQQSESRRLEAVKMAHISKYSANAADQDAWLVLFNSKYGDKIKVDESNPAQPKVYIDDGDNAYTIDDIAQKFNTSGPGAFLMKAQETAVAKPPKEESPTSSSTNSSEMDILTAFSEFI